MKQKVQAKGQPQRWKLIKPLVEAKVIGLFRLIRLSKRIRASDICGVAIKAGKKKTSEHIAYPIFIHILFQQNLLLGCLGCLGCWSCWSCWDCLGLSGVFGLGYSGNSGFGQFRVQPAGCWSSLISAWPAR